MAKKLAFVDRDRCAACGACAKICPKAAIRVHRGCYAAVLPERCVGCGKCARECPAGCIRVKERETV